MTLAYTLLAIAALLTLVAAAALLGAWRAWREVEKRMDEVDGVLDRYMEAEEILSAWEDE